MYMICSNIGSKLLVVIEEPNRSKCRNAWFEWFCFVLYKSLLVGASTPYHSLVPRPLRAEDVPLVSTACACVNRIMKTWQSIEILWLSAQGSRWYDRLPSLLNRSSPNLATTFFPLAAASSVRCGVVGVRYIEVNMLCDRYMVDSHTYIHSCIHTQTYIHYMYSVFDWYGARSG